MKTKILQIIVTLFSILFYQNQILAQDWEWAQSAGGSGFDLGYNAGGDASGNVYMTGNFYAEATFGSNTINSAGTLDVFVAKIDTDGSWVWAKSAGGSSTEIGIGLATDADGNSYVTGSFNESAFFDSHQITSNDGEDIFVAKIDTNGNWLWATSAGGIGLDKGYGVCYDQSGNCYVTGVFFGEAIFGITTLTSYGENDIFIAKLDFNGNWLWAINAGSTTMEMGAGVIADQLGNIYVTGYYEGVGNFGSLSFTSNGEDDIFLAKLDADGNWLWIFSAGGSNNDIGRSLCLDENGDILVTGYFYGNVFFDSHQITSHGLADLFVAKFDAEGNCFWASGAGGNHFEEGYAIKTNSDGDAYISGGFKSNIAYFGDYDILTQGDFDVFAAKIDSNGNWIWANSGGGTDFDYGRGVVVDDADNVFVSGMYKDSATFGDLSLASAMFSDVFIAKIHDDTIGVNDIGQFMGSHHSYPNPFKSTVNIEYLIDVPQPVTIRFYNQFGKQVDIIKAYQQEKNNTIKWQPRGLSAGIYYYSLEAGEQLSIGKLILNK